MPMMPSTEGPPAAEGPAESGDPAGDLRRRQGDAMRLRLGELSWSRRRFSEELAKRGLDVAPQAITQWVLGQTSPKEHTRDIIAEVLGVSYDDLFRPPMT